MQFCDNVAHVVFNRTGQEELGRDGAIALS